MAKLSSPRTELAVLRAACHRSELISNTVLSKADASYFYSEEAQDAFQLIKRIRSDTGQAVSYRMLLEDPHLTKAAATYLRNSQPIIQDKAQALKAIDALAEYRRRRTLAEMANNIGAALERPRVNSKELLENAASHLTRARASKDDITSVRFGYRDNADSTIKKILYEDRSQDVIPTGFKTFDSVNGGFFRGSLVGIAGSTGGGKSTLANQLAVNFASAGYPVDLMPLEMSEMEMSVRIMACVTKFDSLKLLLQKMTPQEQKFVEQRMLKWRKHLRAKQSWYNITKPKEDVTIEEALSLLSVYNSPVKIIDYLGLLAGTDGDDQWRRLGAAARFSKIYAESTNSVVIILAQLDDQGKVRYSRAIAEHCNGLWAFVATKETREQGIITIDQQKARNQRMFTFSLKVDGDMMRVYDLPNNGVDAGSLSQPKESAVPNLADTI